jgi:hypothetical protein
LRVHIAATFDKLLLVSKFTIPLVQSWFLQLRCNSNRFLSSANKILYNINMNG